MGVLGARLLGGVAPAITGRYWPARRLIPGTWEWPAGYNGTGGSNQAQSAAVLTLVPIDLPEAATIARLGWSMTAAAAQDTNVRFGLYIVDEQARTATLVPNSDAGAVLVANAMAAGVILSPALSCPLPAGRVYAAHLMDAALTGLTLITSSPGLDMPSLDVAGQTGASPVGFRNSQAYGPLPGTLTNLTRQGASGARTAIICAMIGSTP